MSSDKFAMKHQNTHTCPPTKKGNLPFEYLKAAKTGNIQEINEFLSSGGDINSSDANGQTMLFGACETGHHHVVRELLKHPELHVNNRFMGVTPLFMASYYGRHECVSLLVEATTECHANLRMKCGFKGINKQVTALSVAALIKNWKAFNILLKATAIIDTAEVPDILNAALDEEQWEVIKEILKPDIRYYYPVFQKLIRSAYIHQLNDIVHSVFKNSMNHDGNRNILNFPIEVFLRKDWENLEALLKILSPTIKLDASVADSLLKKQYLEVSEMLKTHTFDSETLSGIFLVASLGGCSEEIADTLTSDITKYSEDTVKYAFLFATISNRMEFIPSLLRAKKFSYCFLSLASNLAEAQNARSVKAVLVLATAEENCDLFPKVARSGGIVQNGDFGEYAYQ